MLVDHADALPDRIARPLHRDGLFVDQDLAAIRLDQAIQDVHQRALAGAILADERVDLALTDFQIDLVIRQHAGELFRDPAHLDGQWLLGHSAPGTYGMPSAAGGLLRRTTAVRTTSVKIYGVMLSK